MSSCLNHGVRQPMPQPQQQELHLPQHDHRPLTHPLDFLVGPIDGPLEFLPFGDVQANSLFARLLFPAGSIRVKLPNVDQQFPLKLAHIQEPEKSGMRRIDIAGERFSSGYKGTQGRMFIDVSTVSSFMNDCGRT